MELPVQRSFQAQSSIKRLLKTGNQLGIWISIIICGAQLNARHTVPGQLAGSIIHQRGTKKSRSGHLCESQLDRPINIAEAL